MHTLFVFDEYMIFEKITRLVVRSDKIYLFPLTSKSSIRTTVVERIKSIGCNICLLPSSQLINTSACNLRKKYIRFIAEFPEKVRRRGKNLKELFAIDKYTSLWWFSLVAEKNTLKSDSFNQLAQLDSIVNIIKREKIDKIIFSCKSEELKNVLHEYSIKNHIRFKILPIRPIRELKLRIRESQKLLYLKHHLMLIYNIIRGLLRTQVIKRQIGSLSRTISRNYNPLLLLTPYPNINKSLAQKAVFKDKHYTYLQNALENGNRNIIWIAMPGSYTALSLKESLEYAKRFIKNGYNIFFLEEFNLLGKQIKAYLTVLKSSFKFLKLEANICRAHNFGDYNIYPLFKDDWYSSFMGKKGYWGIIYYYMFSCALKKLNAKKCLYLCEMQEWEKALISARDALGIETSLYGYQSGTVSRMYLNYFNHPREVSDGGSYAMPQPDKIVCNGMLPYAYMRESGWPEEKLLVAEAIKYNHIKKSIKQKCDKKKNIIVLAFSISPKESSSILNIAYDSFKTLKDIEVWLKPHPALQIEQVFKLSQISTEDFPFLVKDEPIEKILPDARIVIAGQSGVCIEALSYGCDIIIANVPEWINMSPLNNIKTSIVRTVNSSKELRQTIIDIFKEEYKPEIHMEERLRTINDFFYLNQTSDTPEIFLNLLKN